MAKTETVANAQGATATQPKRGRPAGTGKNMRDPRQVIANVANKAIANNQRAIAAIRKTL
jgi:hypothetical protein